MADYIGMSHPVWVRGLKLEVTLSNNSDYKVAPRVGAWIETFRLLSNYYNLLSHPVWVRGLKLLWSLIVHIIMMSHPVWVRGLKQQLNQAYQKPPLSHPVWVRGLKRCPPSASLGPSLSHPVWVRGLKPNQCFWVHRQRGRTPCGCVD